MRFGARVAERWGPHFLAILAPLLSVAVTYEMAVPVLARAGCPNDDRRVGLSAALPDCRAYEQVSPIDKVGFAAYPGGPNKTAEVSSSGETLAYLSLNAFPGALGNTALYAAHMASRTATGWRNVDWTPEVPKTELLQTYKANYAFSADLSHAVVQIPMIPLTPDATPNVYNLFLRGIEAHYSLVNSAKPARSAEELCGVEHLTSCWTFRDVSAFAGAATDFSRVMFESNGQLTPEAPATGTQALYESSAGRVALVGILPDGTAAATSTAGAGSSVFEVSSGQKVDRSVERAVSPDGSHIIFQAPADAGEPDSAQAGQTEVYDRINGSETIEISAPSPESAPSVITPESATFQAASVDGSRVFFTSTAELTTQSNTGEANNGEDLYEYNLGTKQLIDLTVDTNPEDVATGAMVQGVIASSTDGAYIYFVADGRLDSAKDASGQPNLYMVHNGGRPVFIATMSSNGSCSGEDVQADSCNWSSFPVVHEESLTPDGKHLAFMSQNRLPTVNFPGGYDNTDQETGRPDTEVYEYTSPATSSGTGQLVCISCDPTGARPIGSALIGGISPDGTTTEGVPDVVGIGSPFYRVHALSDDGQRLFYTAPMSPTMSTEGLIEYEQNGVGSCVTVGGCRSLISDQSSGAADLFLGASATGDDVYFATTSKLIGTDHDNLRDVYDARIAGGIAVPPEEARCESHCETPPPTAADGSLSTDVTMASGNLTVRASTPTAHPPTPVKKCRKSFTRRHAKCVKIKRKSQHKKPRGDRTQVTHKRWRQQ